jgi:predicted ATPase
VTIPDEVRETVLSRVRLLGREARDVVLRASVIGARFELGVLAATMHRDSGAIRAALEHACRLQITVPHGAEGCWSFRHAVTRDIIYAELAATRLRPLHHRIVRVLERSAAGGEPPLHDLAYHAWAAGDARRGVRYNETAGDRAVAMHAHDDARLHYGRARALSAAGSRTFERLSEKLRALDLVR